ncbi:hypothetical protein ACSU1N_00525 [Thermogladius sp. 4427co]|uniref:hypothetical protein n=1 Tax=Thermogladius sp. 4427co TaxID=3450718 RepID=UPI003F7B1F10
MDQAIIIVMNQDGRVENVIAPLDVDKDVIDMIARLGYGSFKALAGLASILGVSPVYKIEITLASYDLVVTLNNGRILVMANPAKIPGKNTAVSTAIA